MDEVQVGVKLIPIDQRSVFYMVNYFAALVFGNITFRYTLQYSLTYFYFTTSMIKAIIKTYQTISRLRTDSFFKVLSVNLFIASERRLDLMSAAPRPLLPFVIAAANPHFL
jgi:hypothetical protein